MVKFSQVFRCGFYALLPLFVAVSSADSQQITIQSLDGTVSMTGELLSFEDGFFVIKTRIGEVSVSANGVICIGDGCPSSNDTASFAIAGSNTIGLDLLPNLLEEFAQTFDLDLIETVGFEGSDPAINNIADFLFEDKTGETFAEVSVASGGAESGFGALLNGSADIVMSTRAVRDDEVLAFLSVGLGDMSAPENQTIVGLDGLLILVSRDNPLMSLTVAEIAAVFAGQITNWAELGGVDAPINIYRRAENTGASYDFATTVLGPRQLALSASASIFDTDKIISARVAQDPFGIGFVGFAFENNARAISVKNTCNMVFSPTEFNIKTGEYPLSRRLYLYTTNQRFTTFSKDRSERLAGFLTFVQSAGAQRAVTESGFISQGIAELPMQQQGHRLLNTMANIAESEEFTAVQIFVAELGEAARLSTTFRIRDGNPVLDAQTTKDLSRLVAYLARIDMTGKELVFAGFTDNIGPSDANYLSSIQRATRTMQLARAVLGNDAENIEMAAFGFGEVSPITCNDTVFGRAINRRVEVWIRDAGAP